MIAAGFQYWPTLDRWFPKGTEIEEQAGVCNVIANWLLSHLACGLAPRSSPA